MVSNHDQFFFVILLCTALVTCYSLFTSQHNDFLTVKFFFFSTLTDGREHTGQKFLIIEEQPWWRIELAFKGEPSELADLCHCTCK